MATCGQQTERPCGVIGRALIPGHALLLLVPVSWLLLSAPACATSAPNTSRSTNSRPSPGAPSSHGHAIHRSNHTNNWAVLVSTSRYWLNYRHIVNTLSIYHVVKRLGIPDSNIILMIPDDMACNPRNIYPAQLFNSAAHVLDVYGRDVEVDYRGYEVTAGAFLQVLLGRHEPDVPRSKRMLSDANSNILVYLTGHGGDEFIKFQDVAELLAQDVADALAQMHEKGRYNELLMIVETCEASTLVQRVTAPNVITVASSQKGEQSLSYLMDTDIGMSLVDRFTHQTLTFFERLRIDSTATLPDLFATYSFAMMKSHFSYRLVDFGRPLPAVRLTEFFGSVAATAVTEQGYPVHGLETASDQQHLQLDPMVSDPNGGDPDERILDWSLQEMPQDGGKGQLSRDALAQQQIRWGPAGASKASGQGWHGRLLDGYHAATAAVGLVVVAALICMDVLRAK